MNKFILSLLGLTFALGFFHSSCQKTATQYNDTLTYEMQLLQRVYQNCNIDSPDCAHISYTYPLFKLPQPIADSLNAIVLTIFGVNKNTNLEQSQHTFMAEYEKFKKDFKDSEQSWYSQTNISVPFQSNNVVSLSVEMDDYTGGAHGMYSTIYSNYYKPKNEILSLNKLFSDSNLKKLLSIAEAYFRTANELTIKANLDDAGYWFKENKFHLNDNFVLTNDGATWLFNPYEVASYAQGTIELSVSKNEILPLLNPTYTNLWE
jgi:hypothetical protein